MKRTTFVAAAGSFGLPLGGFAPLRAGAADTYTLRLNLTTPIGSTDATSALRFARAVERRSKGQLKIEVYPSSQLAKEQGILDALATGVVDLQIVSTAILEPRFPRFQIFSLPFLFKDAPTAFRVLDGPIGAEFFAELETKGIVGLGWGTTGFRQLETTSKAVVSPEDVKGLRIRIQPGPLYVAIFQALGAIPVTIDLTEVYTAISTHTVDGLDVPLGGFTDQKLYTVVKHVAMLRHIFSVVPFMGSKSKLEALPAPLQQIIKDEGKSLALYWRGLLAEQNNEYVEILKRNGVAITEVQYPAFRRAMDPVYVGLQTKLGGDLIERVSRAANGGTRN